MRLKNKKIFFKDIARTTIEIDAVRKFAHESDVIEVLLHSGEKKFLNYASDKTAAQDFAYAIRQLKRVTGQIYV